MVCILFHYCIVFHGVLVSQFIYLSYLLAFGQCLVKYILISF